MKKAKKKKEFFLSNVISIRDELTQQAQLRSESNPISMDDAKLIKEITTVIKELDKLINEHEQRENEQVNSSDFYEILKQKMLLNDKLNSDDYE